MHMKNSTYDTLKWIAQILIPAISAFYFGLGQLIPAIPSTEIVCGVLALVDAFLGTVLGISNAQYKKDHTE